MEFLFTRTFPEIQIVRGLVNLKPKLKEGVVNLPFNVISDSAYTLRAHTIPFIKTQSIAEHCGRSAMLLMLIRARGLFKLSEESFSKIFQYLIVHDLHETKIGDIPYVTKMNCKEVCELDKNECNKILKIFKVSELTEEEQLVADFVDMFEFWLKCKEELDFGNNSTKLLKAKERAEKVLGGLLSKLEKLGIYKEGEWNMKS